MNQFAVFGILTALIVGLAIGFQAILAARVSMADNALSTGLVMYIAGGLVAALILVLLYPTSLVSIAPLGPTRIGLMAVGGLAGVIIVVGTAFAFSKISPAAAVALIIFGQMSLAIIADSFGLTGQDPQPLDLRRLGGLVLLAGAIWLLISKPEDKTEASVSAVSQSEVVVLRADLKASSEYSRTDNQISAKVANLNVDSTSPSMKTAIRN